MNNNYSENKKIGNLIALGVFMILLSGIIFSTTTWHSITGIFKVLSLIVFGIIFLFLSVFTNKKLHLKISSLVYWFLSIIFLYFAYISLGYFKLLGNWYSFFGGGYKLFLSNILLTLGLLFIISYKKINKNIFLYLAYNTLYISLATILSFFNINFISSLIIINIIILIINFINTSNKYIKTLQINNQFLQYIIVTIYMIVPLNSYNIESLIFSILSLISLFLISYKVEKEITFFDFIIPFITFIFITKNISLYISNMEKSFLTFTILNFIFTIIYKIIFSKNKNLVNSMYIQNNIYSFICCIVLSSINSLGFLIAAGLLLLINIENKISNSNKIEKYLEPYKVVLFISSLYKFMKYNNNIIDIHIFLIITLFINLMLCFISKDKISKITYYIIGIITAFILSLYIKPNDILTTISIILSLILTCLSFAVINKKDSLNFNIFNYIFYIFVIISSMDCFNSSIINSIITMILILILSYIKLNEKKLSLKISLVALLIPLCDIAEFSTYSSIFVSLYLALLAYIFDRVIEVKDKIPKVTILFVLAIINLFFDELLSVIVMGILLVLSILYFNNRKEFKGLYNFSVIALVITIVYQLRNFWSDIPFWLYLFIGGITIIILVTRLEFKKNNKKEEIDTFENTETKNNNVLNNSDKNSSNNFCIYCGSKLKEPKRFCTHCGKEQ